MQPTDPESGELDAFRPAARDFELWRRLARALHALLGPMSEVVIFDFADLDHAVVCIEGDISHREVGDPAIDPLLSLLRAGQTDDDLHGYVFSLPVGRPMKSSAIWLRDADGQVYGALCVNLDLGVFTQLHELLDSFIAAAPRQPTRRPESSPTGDVQQTLQALIDDAMHDRDGLPILSREGKIAFIARLDGLGAFRFKRAADLVADQLGLGRATVYKYLRQSRRQTGR
jgi:predicted transcriptional regulator YheO